MQPDCALATGISGVIFESSGDSPRSGHSTPPGTASAAAWCACGRLRIPCPGWRQSMALIDFAEQPQGNPLEVVERVAATNGWSFERAGEGVFKLPSGYPWSKMFENVLTANGGQHRRRRRITGQALPRSTSPRSRSGYSVVCMLPSIWPSTHIPRGSARIWRI